MVSKQVKKKPTNAPGDVSVKKSYLVLHNDDIHSFEYVIKALMDVCGHDHTQATQCTMITHYNGKCDIKAGDFSSLKPLKEALIELELKATIN